MPFTGSHPAAVLPLLRSPLPASALAIGSMAPDLPLYLPGEPGWGTHTLPGLPSVDLAIGLAIWALWHGVLAAPALACAPAGVRVRLHGRVHPGLRRRLGSVRALGLVLVALLAGSATHLLWDAFTHPRRWGTAHLAVLRATWHGVPGWMWAQDLSSLFGGVLLVAWLVGWWRRTPPSPRPAPGPPTRAWPWPVLAGIGLLAGVTAWPGQPDPRSAAVAAALRGGAAVALTAAVLAIGWHATRRDRRDRSGRGSRATPPRVSRSRRWSR